MQAIFNIYLDNCMLTAKGMKLLSKCKIPNLSVILIGWVKFGDEGITHFTKNSFYNLQ